MLELNDFLPEDKYENEELFEQFRRKLENQKIHNIGVIGNYGSGKSTFINSFFEWYKKQKQSYDYELSIKENRKSENYNLKVNFQNNRKIRVNDVLANDEYLIRIKTKENLIKLFNLEKIEKNKYQIISLGSLFANNEDSDIKSIEKCILKQFLYSVDKSFLPESRISRLQYDKKNISYKQKRFNLLFWLSLCLCILGLSLYVLFRNSSLIKYGFFKITIPPLNKDISDLLMNRLNSKLFIRIRYFSFFSFLLFLFSSIICFFKTTLYDKIEQIIQNTKISKISTKYFDTDLCDKQEKNILSKYLDELIYYFVKTKVNIVVFEDLDRLENQRIFIHLKELNNILNAYMINNHFPKITFIYSVNDNVFTDKKDQNQMLNIVKFFDFSVPIIPYCNKLNMGNYLIQIKKNNSHDNKYQYLRNDLLIQLGAYIPELRLCKNILNEFEIYTHQLKHNPNIDYSELFSLIVIKNIDVISFKMLEDKDPLVDSLISIKEDLINSILEKKQNELNQVAMDDNEAYTKISSALQDVQKKYLKEFISVYPTCGSKNITNDVIDYLSSETLNGLDDLIDKGEVKIAEDYDEKGNPLYVHHFRIPKTKFSNFKINNISYQEASDKEYYYYGDELETIEQQKKKHQKEIDFLYSASFIELIKSYTKEFELIKQQKREIFSKGKILFEYIEHGFISENYKNHISYFREGLLSKTDEIFINCVKNCVGETKELELRNIEDILSHLAEKKGYTSILINEKILNYSLFVFLCTHVKQHKNQLMDILTYIEENNKISFIAENIDKFDSESKDIYSAIFIRRSSLFYKYIRDYDIQKQLYILSVTLSANFGKEIYSFSDNILINFIWRHKKELIALNNNCVYNIFVLTKKNIL